MNKFLKRAIATIGAATMAALTTTSAQAGPVGLEMVLMMDVSGSISAADFTLQKNGYRDAFNDPLVQSYIAATPGGVAVSLVQWSTGTNLTIGWTLLQNAADATAFAAAINGMGRSSSNSTGTTNALTFSANQIASNAFAGARSVIDVSSDGFDNTAAGCADFVLPCAPLQTARNSFLADATHAINALWIADGTNYTTTTLLQYGTLNLVGGTNSFQSAVTGSGTFDTAIRAKLIREIGQVPEPTSIALVAAALLGLGATRRRKA